MVLANRSLRLASAALLPNLLPAFLVLAVTLLVGEKVNMGAAMIAAVSVGHEVGLSCQYGETFTPSQISADLGRSRTILLFFSTEKG